MASSNQKIRTGTNADIAFVVVILASYFATFSSIHQSSLLDILILVVLGIFYVLFGIYGYAYCIRSDLLVVKGIYFAVQITLGSLIIGLGKGAGYNALIMLPLAGQAVVILPEFWAYLATLGISGAYIFSVSTYSSGWPQIWEGLPTFLAGLIFVVVFTQMAVGEEAARKEVERLVSQLKAANQQLLEYSQQAEEMAVMTERNRMAREIHDGLGHYLTTIHMQIQAALAVMEKRPERSGALLQKASNLTVEALSDVRSSVSTMRSSAAEQPLEAQIKRILSECTSLQTSFVIEGALRSLSPQQRLTIFRTTQEGINNVQKHAQATQACVRLNFEDEKKVRLIIEDNGVGSDQPEGGFGLMGLQERARLLNGDLLIQTAQGQGFILTLELPYE